MRRALRRGAGPRGRRDGARRARGRPALAARPRGRWFYRFEEHRRAGGSNRRRRPRAEPRDLVEHADAPRRPRRRVARACGRPGALPDHVPARRGRLRLDAGRPLRRIRDGRARGPEYAGEQAEHFLLGRQYPGDDRHGRRLRRARGARGRARDAGPRHWFVGDGARPLPPHAAGLGAKQSYVQAGPDGQGRFAADTLSGSDDPIDFAGVSATFRF